MAELARYVPLGILGLIRWITWLVRRVPAALYRPVFNSHREPLSIVVPVYEEDPTVFRRAIDSWLANDVEEIICVIDETDLACQAVASEMPVTLIVTSVPGKRDALRRGWEAASTPLVALVDADTIWGPQVAQQVMMPFADERVGAVGTRQNVLDPRTFWEHVNDMYLDYRYFDENASQTVVGQAVSCVSGRTAVYRRELLLRYSAAFMNESFLGVPCMSGDDKRLTTLVLEGGHRAVLQRNARVWSTFPRDARTFFLQRLRWARNTWRSDLRALGRGWVFRYPFLAFSMMDKAVSAFTLLVSPFYMGLALLHRDWGVAGILAGWWLVSRSAKMLPHLERKPRHAVTMMPLFVPLTFLMALVKIFALLTIRKQRWLTRNVEVSAKTKSVRRTTSLSAVIALMLLVALPARSDAIDRKTVGITPDQFQIITNPKRFAGNPRRHVVVRPTQLDLMTGATTTWSRPFDGRNTSLEAVAAALASSPDPTLVAETSPGVYLLQVALTQAPGTRLVFAAPRVREVRLIDRPDVYLTGVTAEALFRGVHVTSWDMVHQRPGSNPATLRPFIAYAYGSTLRFEHAEISHLGSDRWKAYGIAWTDGSTGEMVDSDSHHNFFGFYTNNAHDVVVRHSVFHHNVVYGIDPHTNTNRMVVDSNEAYANGLHGIIFAVGVRDGFVRNNHVHDNAGNGIMMDALSSGNVIEHNFVERNTRDGIVVTHSDHTTVRGNTVRDHRVGVRVNETSTDTRVTNNRIVENRRGVQVYDGAFAATFYENFVADSTQAAFDIDAEGVSSAADVIARTPVGIKTTKSTQIISADITGVDRGILVNAPGAVEVSGSTINAAIAGVAGNGLLTLRDSVIESPLPVDSRARLLPGNRFIVRPPTLVIAGLGMLAAAVILHQVQRWRERDSRHRALAAAWSQGSG
jgi:parallel beta-helix repeat protein